MGIRRCSIVKEKKKELQSRIQKGSGGADYRKGVQHRRGIPEYRYRIQRPAPLEKSVGR